MLDVLSYWTPTAQEMTDALTAALNAQHARFMARCPGFSGPISICAHSLGSVLAWDILRNQDASGAAAAAGGYGASSSSHFTNDAYGDSGASSSYGAYGGGGSSSDAGGYPSVSEWTPGSGDPRVFALQAEVAKLKAELAAAQGQPRASSGGGGGAGGGMRPHVFHQLSFSVHTLVMLGSPLALFLTLQASEGGGGGASAAAASATDFLAAGVPACTRVVNLLHPHDPIAYRLEPLVLPSLAAQRPALVPYFRNSGRRLGVELTDRIEQLSSSLRGMSALSSAALSKFGLSFRGGVGATDASAVPASSGNEPVDVARARLRALAGVPRDAPEELARVDWQVQAAEIDVPLLAAFTAHLSYWSDADVALFILRACGPAPDVPPIPALAGGAAGSPAKPAGTF